MGKTDTQEDSYHSVAAGLWLEGQEQEGRGFQPGPWTVEGLGEKEELPGPSFQRMGGSSPGREGREDLPEEGFGAWEEGGVSRY